MIQKLNPELFTEELYQWDNSLLCKPHILQDLIREGKIIGFCDGSRLKLRPSDRDYAIMFEIFDDENLIEYYVEDRPNNRFWFHINKASFERILKRVFEETWKSIIDGDNNGITPKGLL